MVPSFPFPRNCSLSSASRASPDSDPASAQPFTVSGTPHSRAVPLGVSWARSHTPLPYCPCTGSSQANVMTATSASRPAAPLSTGFTACCSSVSAESHRTPAYPPGPPAAVEADRQARFLLVWPLLAVPTSFFLGPHTYTLCSSRGVRREGAYRSLGCGQRDLGSNPSFSRQRGFQSLLIGPNFLALRRRR